MKNDHFDAEEAAEAAIDKRKFLIKRLLEDHNVVRKEMMRTINCSMHGAMS